MAHPNVGDRDGVADVHFDALHFECCLVLCEGVELLYRVFEHSAVHEEAECGKDGIDGMGRQTIET